MRHPSKGKTQTVPSVRVRTETDGKDGRRLVFHRPRSSTVDIHGSFVKYIIHISIWNVSFSILISQNSVAEWLSG